MRNELIAATFLLSVIACAQPRERADAAPCPDDAACDGVRIHPPGVLDPESPAFHGRVVEEVNGDLRVCARCHGDDFAGGITGVSCVGCHDEPEGPGACDTCHGSPSSGAHEKHRTWPCATCHQVPAHWDDPGHVVDDPPPAEARFLDPGRGTCTVSCHGEVQPHWYDGEGDAPCGSCHGAPPPGHAWDHCASCHPVGPEHADGVLEVGRAGDDGCDGCHGGGGEPSPPVDLFGHTLTTAPGVGAHRSHREARHRIAGRIACGTCHLVPTATDSPGHIDTPPPAELWPEVGWEAAGATCTDRCHGVAAPRWNVVDQGEAACGSCHAIPPPSHDPALVLTDCVTCHAATVNAFGGIVVTGAPGAETSHHIDGIVDVE